MIIADKKDGGFVLNGKGNLLLTKSTPWIDVRITGNFTAVYFHIVYTGKTFREKLRALTRVARFIFEK